MAEPTQGQGVPRPPNAPVPKQVTTPIPDQPVQIQIQKVDNGYVIQGANIDGQRRSVRRIATSLDDLHSQVRDIADQLFVREDESGPAGPETTAGA